MAKQGVGPIGVAALALALSGCEGGEERRGPPPAPVEVAEATTRPMPVEVRENGTVVADATVELKSEVGGRLARIAFEEGELVEEGQLLFEIEREPYEAALRAAEAALQEAEQAARLAHSEARRYRRLAREGAASEQMLEQRLSAARQARAAAEKARAALDRARIDLERTRIVAPMRARTGALQAHVGDLVPANGAEALVTLRRISPAEVAFAVPASLLPSIRSRMEAAEPLQVEVYAPGAHRPLGVGRLTFVDNAIDEATGTIGLKATFPNEDEALWPGQFVEVRMELGTLPDAVVVPEPAVQRSQQGEFVFVVGPDGKARQRPVATGIRAGGLVQIREGIAPGDRVVTDGQLRLFPGAAVAIREPDEPSGIEGDGDGERQDHGGRNPGEPQGGGADGRAAGDGREGPEPAPPLGPAGTGGGGNGRPTTPPDRPPAARPR